MLADFAAFAGLWHESIVRGPAWRIGDTGRRLERALVVIDLVAAALDGGRGESSGSADVEAAVVEVLLAANESLVAYRRRHRSDVELEAAISLLIHDDTNPRSLVSAIDRLERHALDSDWPVERSLAEPCPGRPVVAAGGAAADGAGRHRGGRRASDRALVLGAGVTGRVAPDRGRDVVTTGARAGSRSSIEPSTTTARR